MGWYSKQKEKETYAQKFADQKFILQKIFDIEDIEDLKESQDSVFSHGAVDNQINFSLFDKKTLKVVEERVSTRELPNYKEKIASGELFACNTNGALSDRNKATGQGKTDHMHQLNLFWNKKQEEALKHHEITTEFPVSPVFAFDPESQHMHEYFSEMYNLYVRLNKENHTNIVGDDYDVLYNLYEKSNYKEIVEKWVNPRITLYKLEADFKKDPSYVEKDRGQSRKEKDEGAIPIIIGHDKIKQLRWGDSKYAVFFTEKGLNFLKIKHTDEDQNIDSSNVME
jgi:hypothetical protein